MSAGAGVHASGPPPGRRERRAGVTSASGRDSEFDRLVARTAECLRTASLEHELAQALARDVVLDAVRFALAWAGA